jgi:hypothetical protein
VSSILHIPRAPHLLLRSPTKRNPKALWLEALVGQHTGSFGLKVEPLPVKMVPQLNLRTSVAILLNREANRACSTPIAGRFQVLLV